MAQSKKSTTKPKSKPGSRKKPSKLFLLGIIVLVLIFAWLIYTKLAQQSDAKRFQQAKTTQELFSDQIQSTNNQLSDRVTKDICFKTEQGPYDEGNLWCRTSTALYFSSAISKDSLMSTIESKLNDLKYDVRKTGSAYLEFSNAKSIECRVEILTGISAQKPGSRFPDNQEAQATILTVCADRAKAKHYPFVE